MIHTRRYLTYLLLALLVTSALPAQDDSRWDVVPNINDLADWSVQPNSPALAKAMGDAAEYVLRWKAPGNAEDWRVRRPHVELALKKALGLTTLPERTPLNVRIVSTDDRGDYIVDNIIYDSRPGFPVTGNLYRPKVKTGPRPAILSPIGHLLHDGKRDTEVQARSIKLAKMGFIVLSYDAIGHGERMVSGNNHHEAGFALMPFGEHVTGWMVWDSMRGIDYLLSRPDVDPARIGVTGNSGGGLNTLYTAAVDPRVAVAVITGYTFEFNNWIKYAGAHGTCSYIPDLFHEMEWFEIAGLIAPRPLFMLNGEDDGIFPLSGARKAANNTAAIYSVLGHNDRVRFYPVPKQRHGYSRPYREQMYGWMAKYLFSKTHPGPVAEGRIETLPEDDPRLLCDPEGKLMSVAPSVVDLARKRGEELVGRMPAKLAAPARDTLLDWVRDITAPPYVEPHNLMARHVEDSTGPGAPEKVFFVSEVGQHIPSLLWKPPAGTAIQRVIIVADGAGKGSTAESDWLEPLRLAGNAILAVDTRGRGETLGHMGNRTNNYQLVSISFMAGHPLAGRRAFDLTRAVDFVAHREDLPLEDVILMGRNGDDLPVLLAAVADQRVKGVIAEDYVSSFVSQMIPPNLTTHEQILRGWNQALMGRGKIEGKHYTVDLASIIPSALEYGDIPHIAQLLADRKLLFIDALDRHADDTKALRQRFDTTACQAQNTTCQPSEPVTADRLLEWLKD
jgi:cephalosporin-C deacetylase-like acetyl esterase